jgi:hypothetical protein
MPCISLSRNYILLYYFVITHHYHSSYQGILPRDLTKGITIGIRCDHFPLCVLERLAENRVFPENREFLRINVNT